MLALCLLLAAEVPGGFATASNQSLFFDHPVVRRGFHFQVAFGFGGGPDNEGLFHAMEVGGTFDNGLTVGLLHTFVQNKGVIGPERGPDLLGGWMLELKVPLFYPEFDLKLAAGLGGLHDQSDGIRFLPGLGWSYGLDVHLPFFDDSGLTIGFSMIQVVVDGTHYLSAATSLGYTFF